MKSPSYWKLSFLVIAIVVAETGPRAQDPADAISTLDEYRSQPASAHRDSAIMRNYLMLIDANAGLNEELSDSLLDAMQKFYPRAQWDRAEAIYYRARGRVFDRRGIYDEALRSYTTAIEAFEKVGDRFDDLAHTYILKAFVLFNNGMPDECAKVLEQIRPVAEQLENKNFLAWILDFYGDLNFYSRFGINDYETALGYYLQIEALLPQVPNTMIHADNAHGLAGCYFRLGDEDKALEYRDKALAIARKHGHHSVIFAVYGDLADLYEARGNFNEAIRYRLLSLEYAKQAGWIEMESRAQSNLARTYKSSGNFEKSLEHFEQLRIIEDSLSRYKVQIMFNDLEAKYASSEKDLEIQQLRAHNLAIIRNVLLFLLLAGIGFVIYYLVISKQLRKQNASLESKNAEIQAALAEGQNMERKRLAITLHDNVNAKIAATKWMLETLYEQQGTPQDKAFVERLIESVTDIYDDVRFMSHNLVPRDVASKSLPELVAGLVNNLNQNQKIAFTYRTSGPFELLPETYKQHAYSIVLELVNNVIRHSDCETSEILLNYEDGMLHLHVSDNGIGFDPDIAFEGSGLRNIRSRIEGIKGTMHIEKDASGGVAVIARIPVKSMPVQGTHTHA